jgi:hypothetical protein
VIKNSVEGPAKSARASVNTMQLHKTLSTTHASTRNLGRPATPLLSAAAAAQPRSCRRASSSSSTSTSGRGSVVARSYVEPSVSKDWHKLDVKHVSAAGQCLALQVLSKGQSSGLGRSGKCCWAAQSPDASAGLCQCINPAVCIRETFL